MQCPHAICYSRPIPESYIAALGISLKIPEHQYTYAVVTKTKKKKAKTFKQLMDDAPTWSSCFYGCHGRCDGYDDAVAYCPAAKTVDHILGTQKRARQCGYASVASHGPKY